MDTALFDAMGWGLAIATLIIVILAIVVIGEVREGRSRVELELLKLAACCFVLPAALVGTVCMFQVHKAAYDSAGHKYDPIVFHTSTDILAVIWVVGWAITAGLVIAVIASLVSQFRRTSGTYDRLSDE